MLYFESQNKQYGADKMDQWIEALFAKPDNLSLTPGTEEPAWLQYKCRSHCAMFLK